MDNKKSNWNNFWKSNRSNFSKKILDFGRKYYFAEMTLKQLGEYREKLVLEPGSGSCESLVYIAKKAKKVVALDNAPEAIMLGECNFKAAKINKEKYDLVLGDIFDIPFSDNSFDLVFNAGVIEHFSALKPLQEMIRVTKKDGQTIILVPAKYSLYTLFFKILSLGLKGIWEEHKFYTKKMMRKELLQAGAKRIRVKHPLSLLGVYIVGIAKK